LYTSISCPPKNHSMVPCPFATWLAISFTYSPPTALWKNYEVLSVLCSLSSLSLARDREVDIRVATNTVQHAPTTPSVVELPVFGHQKQTRERARPTC
jgi:hypothetical protein